MKSGWLLASGIVIVGLAFAGSSFRTPVMPTADVMPPDGGTSLDATSCLPTQENVCGNSGEPGCAGQGGGGGLGGQGGGAAIALFVSNGTVTVNHGGFFVQYGGQGGNGGGGQPGGNGSTGNAGSSATCYSGCDLSCNFSGSTQLAGGAGGTASNGGPGGNGGGGAGGPVYFYATANGGQVVPTPDALDASVWLGAPGTGGSPNGPDGGAFVHN